MLARHNTASCPDNCHVMNMSMGPHGVLRFICFEADLFSKVMVLCGMIMPREEVKPTLRRSVFGLFIPFEKIWGTEDNKRMKTTGGRFRETLDDSDLDYHFMRYEGDHRWSDWKGVIAEALRVQVAGEPLDASGSSGR